MKKLLLAILAGAALAALPAVSARAAENTMPAVGQKAPTFTLPTQTGTPVSLQQFRGKWVVLYFYPRDMSPGCTIEAHNFERSLPEFKAKNAVVLGVSVDSAAMHREFAAKDGLTYHLLADTSHKVTSEYGSLGSFGSVVIANRNTFLINPQGRIAKVWTKVDPRESASEVLAAIPARHKG